MVHRRHVARDQKTKIFHLIFCCISTRQILTNTLYMNRINTSQQKGQRI